MRTMRFVGSMAVLVCLAGVAHAGEVHTRTVAGTWASDAQRGTFTGSIPNDGGYSFWLTPEQIDLATPVTVIAQIRFRNHVDYGGAGVALIDPNATNQAQKNLRIELSEREDTAGVGGWLGNENHFSGASKRASKDIKPGEWYELALKIDGVHAIGFLDGTEVFNADVPELSKLPKALTVAPFIVEADVEIRVIVRRGASTSDTKPAAPAAAARIASIEPYGHDDTDGSDVAWSTGLPRPSFNDDPGRGGTPNAEWNASYELKDKRLCVRLASLRAPNPPVHTLAIGYRVTLDGAIFDNGSNTKTIVVTRFSGTPTQATAGVCEAVELGTPRVAAPEPTKTTPAPGPKVDPVNPYDDPPPVTMPVTGRIGDTLPKTSKKQAEIEKRFAANVASATGPADYRKMYGSLDELILVVGRFHFLLEPVSRQWHFYNRVHDTWEPTGFFAGEATFSVVRGKVKVTKKKKGRS
jgi:hypothetical protein